MITLYDYFRSSASFRVRIALNLKKLDYHIIPIHLLNNGGEQYSEHYQKINPQSLVPTLQHGNKVLTQSLSIIEFLEEEYPEPPLLPQNSYEKALIRSFALSIAADIHPINNLRVLNYLTHELSINDQQKIKWYDHWIHKGLSSLETQLKNYDRVGKFCFGDEPTLADIVLIPQLYNAKRFNCNLNLYPTLLHVESNCVTHPAFYQAWPREHTVPQKEKT